MSVVTAGTASPRERKPVMQFRLLAGQHTERRPLLDEDGQPVLQVVGEDRDGNPRYRQQYVQHMYNQGDVIETTADLLKLNSLRPGTERKFERIDNEGQLLGQQLSVAEAEKMLAEAKAREALALHREGKLPLAAPVSLTPQTPAAPAPISLSALAGAGSVKQSQPAPSGKPQVPANLDQLTLKQLQDYAAEEEIDLKGAKSAEEARRVIRAGTAK